MSFVTENASEKSGGLVYQFDAEPYTIKHKASSIGQVVNTMTPANDSRLAFNVIDLAEIQARPSMLRGAANVACQICYWAGYNFSNSDRLGTMGASTHWCMPGI